MARWASPPHPALTKDKSTDPSSMGKCTRNLLAFQKAGMHGHIRPFVTFRGDQRLFPSSWLRGSPPAPSAVGAWGRHPSTAGCEP